MSDVRAPAVLEGDGLGIAGADSRAEAFRRLTERHLDASYRLARVIVGDHAEAEDAVHDACLTAWQKWATLRDPERFEAWFGRILVNTCRNRLQRASRVRVVDVSAELGSRSPTAGDDQAAVDRRADLGVAIARLGPDDRVILALRYYRDLPIDEIGRLLGVPSGTVKSRVHNALRRLHDVLDETETEEARS
jgi:RNA polymerase sigma-70 factor (ECF subfamily)